MGDNGIGIIIQMVGRKFGRLEVLKRGPNSGKNIRWHCKCECGGKTLVPGYELRIGRIVSCGCYRLERVSEVSTKHGHTSPPSKTYKAWQHAKSRCYCKTDKKFPNYGGRGIRMCDRWLNSFENFLADMGECPAGLTIDRIDVNGHYEPTNCHWATYLQQGNNTTRNKFVDLPDGTKITIAQLATKHGVRRRGPLYKIYAAHGSIGILKALGIAVE